MSEASANEIKNSAVNIGLNKTGTYALSTYDAQNWYKFTVTESGYFQLYLGANADTDTDEIGWGWKVSIYTESDLSDEVYSFTTKASDTTPKFPLGKRTYYVKVEANYAVGSYAPTGCKYDIRADFTAASNWEAEENDSNLTAQSISLNTLYRGTLYTTNDVDYYQFKLTKDGYFKLSFDVSEADIENVNDGWTVSVYQKGSTDAIRTYKLKASETEPVLPYKAGTYYVSVKATYAASGTSPVNEVYGLKVIFKESTTWEKEGNDTSSTATALKLNTAYKGITTTSTDVDWYSFKLSAKSVVKLSFSKDENNDIESIQNGWNVGIYNKADNKCVVSKEGITSGSNLSATLAKGTYYVKVTPNYYYAAPTDCIYNLKVSYAATPAKPVSVKAAAGKASVKTSWEKASKATGYVVYRSSSKNGKYTRIATLKDAEKISYTDKKAKSGTTYYYKVKAYNNANGVTAYSSYSAVVSAKAK